MSLVARNNLDFTLQYLTVIYDSTTGKRPIKGGGDHHPCHLRPRLPVTLVPASAAPYSGSA